MEQTDEPTNRNKNSRLRLPQKGTINRNPILRLCGAFALAFLTAVSARAEDRFLALSDLHFNPISDPALVDSLVAAAPERWAPILDGAANKRVVNYRYDTNWPLLRSALGEMRTRLPHPAFIIISGDFLAHNFRKAFYAAANPKDDAVYRQFVIKVIGFIALQLQQRFPGVSILPTLGNDDAICGDYQIEPNGPLLVGTLPIIRSLVRVGPEQEFARTWTSYGNYHTELPGRPAVELISLNTVFFSPRYKNACGRPDRTDPAAATLNWLAAQLDRAASAHRRVWLLYHIPPGIDAYTSFRAGSCPASFLPMWNETDVALFDALMRRYAAAFAIAFAGHTHTDDIRLFDGNGFALITPAISPIFGENPAFRVISLGAGAGIRDIVTYDLVNLSAAATTGASPEWKKEYSFDRSWGVSSIDRATLGHLYNEIGENAGARERWMRFFAVSSQAYWYAARSNNYMAGLQRAEYCATGHLQNTSYGQCYCRN